MDLKFYYALGWQEFKNKKGKSMIAFMQIAQIGIVAGFVMGMAAMLLNKIKFTSLDLTRYMGGLLTGQPVGKVNFIAGFSFHMLASVLLAWIYVYGINY